MNPNPPRSFPSAAVKVRLLQDAVYSDDSELWTRMSLQARAWVKERFDIVRQTEDLEMFYDECMARYRPVKPSRSESDDPCKCSQSVSKL